MANKKPTKRNHFFLNPSIKNEIPIAIPIVPLEIVWRSVEPRNRIWPVRRLTVAPSIESGLTKNKAFSNAAKPKAAVMR